MTMRLTRDPRGFSKFDANTTSFVPSRATVLCTKYIVTHLCQVLLSHTKHDGGDTGKILSTPC
jgi:hypothetical protein